MLKIKKELTGGTEDIFIGTVYLSPPKLKNDDEKKMQVLLEEIMHYKERGQVIIQGFFNAHTNTERDYQEPDKFDITPVLGISRSPINRNSEDKIPTDNRGKKLLEICKSLNLFIVNGRKTGDSFGKYTSFQWNGSSVVDYVIASQTLFNEIIFMKVGNFVPWISDHCATHFQIALHNPEIWENLSKQTTFEYSSLFWGSDISKKFTNALKEYENVLNSVYDASEIDMRSQFTNTLLKIADIAGIKPIRKRKSKKDNNPLWFDRQCRVTKNRLRHQANLVKKHPYNTNQRIKLFEEKRKFKSLVRKKKRQYKEDTITNMTLNRKNGRKFWKLVDKLDLQKKNYDFLSSIPTEKWENHFNSILRGGNEPAYPPDCTDKGPLDYEITSEELENAKYILRNGKASGIDQVSNEMLMCVVEYKPNIIIRLFNYMLDGKTEDKCISILTPIHKKGSRTDPSNYRGVSLLSCISKLFSAILNKRLFKYVKDKKILSDEQLGFVPGNRTSDAHVIIHNLIKHYCHQKGKMIYSCFVDFKKAFDCIPRDKLFEKLKTHGITGNFFNTLKSMYTNDSCKIKIDGILTNTLYPNQGVRQGCILSPLLFNIFLADLPTIFNAPECQTPIIEGRNHISSITWADDLILFSESESGLNKMMSKLSNYNEKNGLEINIDKTKCMIFNKTGRLIRRNFKYRDKNIGTIREYKYLGFVLTPSGEIVSGLHDLKDRAARASAHLRTKMGEYFRKHLLTTLKLFDALIKPILLYMADFWGCLKMPKNNPIEVFHNKFLKQLLGVQTQTTNIGVLLETGRIPMSIHAKKVCVKNWGRIVTCQCNNIVQMSYQNSVENNLVWSNSVKQELETNGLYNIYLNNNNNSSNNNNNDRSSKRKPIENIFFQRVVDIFHQNAFAEIRKNDSKLRTYSIIKKEIGLEKYLSQITAIHNRIALTKFRLSNHSLMIEKGRHLRINKNKRFCSFCPHEIEDELHFLLSCETFKLHRRKLFENVNTRNDGFLRYDQRTKFTSLLTDPEVIHFTAIYLYKTLEIRDFLLKQPKNNI